MYNCFDIATYFLKLAEIEGSSIKTMKLLKLAYIAHGYHLGFFEYPLFKNRIEAWKYGPVIPDLYRVIRRFGSKFSVDIDTTDLYSENELSKEDREFLEIIWSYYKKYNGFELSALTHKENTPWEDIYKKFPNQNVEIPNEVIQSHYSKLISERQ